MSYLAKSVPRTGLEPARLAALAPETSASTIPPPGLLCFCAAKLRINFGICAMFWRFFSNYFSEAWNFIRPGIEERSILAIWTPKSLAAFRRMGLKETPMEPTHANGVETVP